MDQNETVELARAADVHGERKILGVGDAIEHESERAVRAVLQKQDDAAREESVIQRRPSDQEGTRQRRHGAPHNLRLALFYPKAVPTINPKSELRRKP